MNTMGMSRMKRSRLSDPIMIKDHLNKAYSELAKVRHVSKSFTLTPDEYKGVLDLFKLLGMIRSDQLTKESKLGG